MSFGDHVETRSELEAAELERTNRVSDRLLTNERPDGDSHWASVVIDDAFEPRELTEAESVLLYESGIGIDVERMWIRPGVRKGPTATNEDTGEVTPYGEALPSIVARNSEPCDCETPGDWHRVANDFQRAMFEERARAEKAEDDLIVRHEQLQEALDQLELFFDPRERNDVNIDAGDILRKHRRVGPGMERGRPDDELEAALDADNPDPPLRS